MSHTTTSDSVQPSLLSIALAWLGDVPGLIAVALCWGFTNPFIKRATSGLAAVSARHAASPWLVRTAAETWFLLSSWRFVLPFAINLSGSAVYYYTLGRSRLSLVVPITSSLTLAFTAVAGAIIGEDFGSS
ncbi:hypothetical protein HK405_002576, partial [Cladochytrium tenue]